MRALKYIVLAVIIALSFTFNGIAGPLDTNSGQAPENIQPQHNMSNMDTEAPPEAYQKKPMPKEGMNLTNLPWNVPWGGIFLVAFLIFFPFLLIIGMGAYKLFFKKKAPKQNQ